MRHLHEMSHSDQPALESAPMLAKTRRTLLANAALCMAAALPNWVQAAAPTPFSMGTDAKEADFYGLWLRKVYTEALKRLDLKLEVVSAPSAQLNEMADSGRLDGDMLRAPAYAAAHPDMLRVDVVLLEVVFRIYVNKPVTGVTQLESLRTAGLRGAYRRGVVMCENTLKPLLPANLLTEVLSTADGMDVLAKGQADFFCELNTSIANVQYSGRRRDGMAFMPLFDISPVVPLYPYLHRRHAALVPQLAAALTQMKAAGQIARFETEAADMLSNPLNE